MVKTNSYRGSSLRSKGNHTESKNSRQQKNVTAQINEPDYIDVDRRNYIDADNLEIHSS